MAEKNKLARRQYRQTSRSPAEPDDRVELLKDMLDRELTADIMKLK